MFFFRAAKFLCSLYMYILFNSQQIKMKLYHIPLPFFVKYNVLPSFKTILRIVVIVFCIKNGKIQKKWKNNMKKQNKKRNKSKIGYKEKKRIHNKKRMFQVTEKKEG